MRGVEPKISLKKLQNLKKDLNLDKFKPKFSMVPERGQYAQFLSEIAEPPLMLQFESYICGRERKHTLRFAKVNQIGDLV